MSDMSDKCRIKFFTLETNVSKLKSDNPVKHQQGIEKLARCLAL
jgi:hypothetical protein